VRHELGTDDSLSHKEVNTGALDFNMMLIDKLDSMEHTLLRSQNWRHCYVLERLPSMTLVSRPVIPHIRVGYSVRFDPKELRSGFRNIVCCETIGRLHSNL
jgi:hypothetical protein